MSPLDELKLFDPDLAPTAVEAAAKLPPDDIGRMAADTLWASSMEPAFGRAVLEGYAGLAAPAAGPRIAEYHRQLREFGSLGPAFGRLMAVYLVPVLRSGDPRLTTAFIETVATMRQKGNYTLPAPLDTLSTLLNSGEIPAAKVFLDLLQAVFCLDLSYVRCQHFAYVLSRAVLSFPPARRPWQTAQLCRVVRIDPLFADPFLEGIHSGLHLLSEASLAEFVSQAIYIFARNQKQAIKFISLASRTGIEAFRHLQVTVSFAEVQAQLNRYLHARIGRGVSVRPQSALPAAFSKVPLPGPTVASDSRFIYLPDEIGHFPTRAQNRDLYKTLTRLEGGHFEFGSFDFDLDKMANLNGMPGSPEPESDLKAFLDTFPDPELAGELFTAFEYGRIRKCLSRSYPGLIRRCLPVLQQEARRLSACGSGADPIRALYFMTALGMDADTDTTRAVTAAPVGIGTIFKRFDTRITPDAPVEACGLLVAETYPDMARLRGGVTDRTMDPQGIGIPFGRRLRPDLVSARRRSHYRRAQQIRGLLQAKGYRVYTSDICRRLVETGGKISAEAIGRIIAAARPAGNRPPAGDQDASIAVAFDGSGMDLETTASLPFINGDEPDDSPGYPVFRYDEWDSGVSDYLKDHVRVCQRPILDLSNDFYPATLSRHQGLVKRMRYAFELLKPQGLKLLRRWVEGDEFDYRALLDAALDKKAGLIPSDRLYNKRIKQQREVSVLLLVDLSRSTANPVRGSQTTVLEVEKEAIVLFCEALTVVGDNFSIAGFSGTGRLGVDYYRVKDFEETVDDAVRQRISALVPQRATRMGAAIRHAVSRLEQAPSRVRLLIILGDGFPNDVDYKQGYAVADTRRAVFEARSKDIFTHAITVNIAGDPRLDDLYGPVRHTVISDVRELPDKLLRIYGSLTRY